MPRQKSEKRTHSEAFGTSDSQPQQLYDDDLPASDAQPTIVLQIGSSTLTLGFATDPTPQSIPHIIAYKGYGLTTKPSNKSREGIRDETLVLDFPWIITPALEDARDSSLSKIQESLELLRAGAGIHDTEVNVREYLAHNSRVQPEARESEELSMTDISAQPRCLIGNEVLYLPPGSGYTVYRPLRYGQLNCTNHDSLPQWAAPLSRSALLSMLEDLWTKAFEEYLQIDKRDFKNHRIVLLVSDVINRALFKEFMNILLVKMEFAAAFLHQESVCAAYCAGMASCCVVNVGDEVTHISCIEEGMSNPNTRLILHYGGSDITRLFFSLLQKTKFPYSKCTSESRLDGVLIQQLKETVCHLDATIWGVRNYQFSVMSPLPGRLLDYEIKLSDEGIIAAMGMFFPAAFCLPDYTFLMRGQQPQAPEREDLLEECLDIPLAQRPVEQSENLTSEEQLAGMFVGHPLRPGEVGLPEVTRRIRRVNKGRVLPLDQAVHLSISCTSSLELKGKLYSSILLVGGGLSFPGSSKMLQSQLERNSPPADSIDVYSNVRELDSSHIAWKGGAVLSCLDTCHELWIDKQEWDFSGVRLLRERAPFLW
ncbi:actin-related protein 8-like isoform X2 [Halichondria panicea]|uniref:actin-related protein 8-like isoform X2 n=1 Tax=Halichondria panicea TaxID=6063 RepID=UPI00312B6E17